jgi:hypothetical protein
MRQLSEQVKERLRMTPWDEAAGHCDHGHYKSTKEAVKTRRMGARLCHWCYFHYCVERVHGQAINMF